MYQKGELETFNIEVIKENSEYIVKYSKGDFTGECRYQALELMGQKKPIRQRPLLLTHCSMGDIIEKLHLENTLSSEDFHLLSKDIREHSLSKVVRFIEESSEPMVFREIK